MVSLQHLLLGGLPNLVDQEEQELDADLLLHAPYCWWCSDSVIGSQPCKNLGKLLNSVSVDAKLLMNFNYQNV